MGSLAAALGPACFFFLRPMRVVGCGGGSYLGFSFWRGISAGGRYGGSQITHLVAGLFVLVIAGRSAARARLLVALPGVSTCQPQRAASLPWRVVQLCFSAPNVVQSKCGNLGTVGEGRGEGGENEVWVLGVYRTDLSMKAATAMSCSARARPGPA